MRRHSRRSAQSLRANPARHRRLLLEQLENRRLLATANYDSFPTPPNTPVDAGAWGNDLFNEWWYGEPYEGCIVSEHHEGYTEPEQYHPPYWHHVGDWHDGDPGYYHEEDTLHEGYTVPEIWHPPEDVCLEMGMITPTLYAKGKILSGPSF